MHELRRELRGLLRALIEVARQDGPLTGAEVGVLLSFIEGWAMQQLAEPMNHRRAQALANSLARQVSKPDNLPLATHAMRRLRTQAPARVPLMRRHLEAMAELNALPNGRQRAAHRLLLRTLG